MRFAHISCAAAVQRQAVGALVVLLALLAIRVPAQAQGVVTLPSAIPASGAPCNCTPGTPGCNCSPGANLAPGVEFAPEVGPVTTWDPYTVQQPGMLQVMPAQPTLIPGPCAPCAAPQTFRFGIYGEYLYLRAGDSTTTDFAVPINGGIVPPAEPTIPVGPIATLNPEYDSGYRAGFWWQRTCESQIGATYTHFETQTSETVAIDPASNVVLLSLVVHPATVAADFFYDVASAQYDLEYTTIDLDYRHVVCSDCVYRVNYVAGVRFLHYEDQFGATFTSPTRIDSVLATNAFDGFGLRGGLEGEWGGQQGGLFGYGKLIGGAVAGELSSSYTQSSNFDGVVVATSRDDERILPTVEVEVGIGWRSSNQRWRLSAGYNITAIFNLASASSLVQSVRTAQYAENEDTFTLDGLVARLEFAF